MDAERLAKYPIGGVLMRPQFKNYFRVFFSICYFLLILFPLVVSAAQVTLQWDPNGEIPDGYNLYQRLENQSYDYSDPFNESLITGTIFPVDGLSVGQTYHFVVRSVSGNEESGDSNEVTYVVPVSDPDSDSDGYLDIVDAFPHDNAEWLDTDGDGLGNNTDTDDDGDGMSDTWEELYGMDPLDSTDAQGDLDGDGISNLDEHDNDTDPSLIPGNSSPNQPVLAEPADGAMDVDLMPNLMTEPFEDPDGHAHSRTRYQIATSTDWASDLVFEGEFTLQLTSITLGDLILDPETTYYWRVRFYDEHNGISDWSTVSSFTTMDHVTAGLGDDDGNGILNDQEVSQEEVDPGLGDTSDMVVVGTSDETNPQLAVLLSSNADMMLIRAVDADSAVVVNDANRPEVLTGVISFKLRLLDGATSASVTVNLSTPAPQNAVWYKYNIENGWTPYPDVTFSGDRKSITIYLVDGGPGDDDGVQNGVIVDPSGLGYSASDAGSSLDYSSQTDGSSSFASGFAGVCFISAPLSETPLESGQAQPLFLLMSLIGVGAMMRMNRQK